jgi:hypothetical protein
VWLWARRNVVVATTPSPLTPSPVAASAIHSTLERVPETNGPDVTRSTAIIIGSADSTKSARLSFER